MDATQPWARQAKEPAQWYDRFQRFLLLGPARSVYAAYRAEQVERANARRKNISAARSGLPKSWREQAHRWNWYARANVFDEVERKRRDELYRTRADEILTSGFAQRFARIAELNRLAELLQAEIWTEDKRWMPDVKQIGSGEDAERVDLVRFNASVIQQYRETLEDIAIEMGERVRGMKVSGSIGVAQITADDMARAAAEAKAWELQFEAQQHAPPAKPTDE